MDTSLRPSTCTSAYFLFESEERFHYTDCEGKWMYFFPRYVIDDRWDEAVELYRAGKLPGIASMKVSTAVPNPRARGKDHVLIFYCGPPPNKNRVMEIGRKLVAAFPPAMGTIYYKSDEQTMGGTRATGQKKNSLYTLAGCVTRPNQARSRTVPVKTDENQSLQQKTRSDTQQPLPGSAKRASGSKTEKKDELILDIDSDDDVLFVQEVKKQKTE